MSRLLRSARFLVLLLMAMTSAMPALVSVVDGGAAKPGASSVMHAEAPGANHCAAVHSADCALCEFMTGAQCVAASAAPVALTERRDDVVYALVAPFGTIARYRPHSRAPPTTTA